MNRVVAYRYFKEHGKKDAWEGELASAIMTLKELYGAVEAVMNETTDEKGGTRKKGGHMKRGAGNGGHGAQEK